MRMKAFTLLVAAVLFVALAGGSIASEEEIRTREEKQGNDRSEHGLCNAWQNNAQGRERGGAANSTAFLWLRAQAGNLSVEEHCAGVAHPGDARGNGANSTHAAEDAHNGNATRGPPEHANATRGPPGHANAHGRNETAGPPYGQANGHGQGQGNARAAERGRGA